MRGEEFAPGAVVWVSDNLRLRSADSMDGSAIVTIQKGSLLEVIGTGKNETIDGIDSSWVKVKALESTQDKDGSFVQEETEGWCFGGYLTPVKGGKKYEICFPGVGTQSVVINSIYEYNRDGKEIYTRTSDGFEKWYEYDENGRIIKDLHLEYIHLNENGEIWVVIQKKQGAPSAKKNLEKVFGNVEIVKRDKGYYILKAINK